MVDPSKQYRKSTHTAEKAAAEIRRAIWRRELLPGEHVRQEHWALLAGVSSSSVREALKMLVVEQLLVYEAHRGYFVARIDDQEMEDIYLIRGFLEAEVLRRIRWPSAYECRKIRRLMDAVLARIESGDGHGALEAARTFRFTIFDYAPGGLLVSETKRYWDKAVVYRALSMGLVQPTNLARLSEYYATFLHCLEIRDREGLVKLNTAQREAVPRDVHSF
ncbi:MAG: GntR family transcriptional regulator [Acidimicrobiaceae bacterium]|nr:GntR family transcriptional regulator [Acidimicrobiaceae bacterium]